MSDFNTIINLLESNKKDIITVVNARNEALEVHIKSLDDRVKKQNSRIGKMEVKASENKHRIEANDRILFERGATCFVSAKEYKESVDSLRIFAWIGRQKKLSFLLFVLSLVVIQSGVYFMFSVIEIEDIFKKIF